MKTPEDILRKDRPIEGIDPVIASFRYPRVVKRPYRWPAVAGFASALAVGAIAFRLSIPTAQASVWASIVQAEQMAPRCTLRFSDDDGRVWGFVWQEGRKARFDFDPDEPLGSKRGTDGKRTWFVSGESHTAVIANGGTRIVAPIIARIADYHGREIESKSLPNGGFQVTLERKASATSLLQRDVILADADKRPISVEHRVFRKGRWQVNSRETREYEAAIPDAVFAFDPPKGYEVYDLDANAAKFQAGLRNGPVRTVAGISVRLVGVLQDRHGVVSAVYSGGEAPLSNAVAHAERDGKSVVGKAAVGNPPSDPSKEKWTGPFAWPTQFDPAVPKVIENGPAPFATLDGVALQVIRFRFPKVPGNEARRLRITLPVVGNGRLRTVGGARGIGVPKGVVTFDVVPISSNRGEEIYQLPGSKRAAYELPLRRG